MSGDDATTYLLVDGENLDATLGVSILGRRPVPGERPRWDRVRDFAANVWDQPVRGLFFLNATSGQLPIPFVQALIALGYRPIPLSGAPGEKVVDIGIQRTLEALAPRRDDVMLASHDGDFVPQMEALLDGGRRVGLLAFNEFLSSGLRALTATGLQIFDLEDQVRCFDQPLPRVRIISIDDFDPAHFLL